MDDLYQCVKCNINETMNQSIVIDLGKDVDENISFFFVWRIIYVKPKKNAKLILLFCSI